MAHFAEIDNDNVVLRVLVVSNEEESRGQDFLANDLGLGGKWIQTSYSNSFRFRFAGIGSIYLEAEDLFVPPKPFLSWVLNQETWDWESPAPYPDDEKMYTWNEPTLSWVEITGE